MHSSPDVLRSIFAQLDPISLRNVLSVQRSWYEATLQGEFWKRIFRRDVSSEVELDSAKAYMRAVFYAAELEARQTGQSDRAGYWKTLSKLTFEGFDRSLERCHAADDEQLLGLISMKWAAWAGHANLHRKLLRMHVQSREINYNDLFWLYFVPLRYEAIPKVLHRYETGMLEIMRHCPEWNVVRLGGIGCDLALLGCGWRRMAEKLGFDLANYMADPHLKTKMWQEAQSGGASDVLDAIWESAGPDERKRLCQDVHLERQPDATLSWLLTHFAAAELESVHLLPKAYRSAGKEVQRQFLDRMDRFVREERSELDR